jgi:membrane protein
VCIDVSLPTVGPGTAPDVGTVGPGHGTGSGTLFRSAIEGRAVTRNARPREILTSLVDAARSEQITFIAASLAYYTFVSVIPLLLLVLVVASTLGGEELAARLVRQVGAALSPAGQDLLREALLSDTGRGSATLLGVGVLVWGALKVFRGLDIAFSQVYGTDAPASLPEQVKDAAVALTAVGAGIAITVLVGALISLSGLGIARIIGPLALAVALTITFLPLYLLLPDSDVTLREALPGAVLAGGGWTLLGTLFRIYAENAAGFQLYGVIGGVLLLVTWFYLGSIVLLLGGVLNAVLAGRVGTGDVNRQLQQEPLRGHRQRASMTDEHGDGSDADDAVGETPDPSDDAHGDRDIDAELAEIRDELATFEDEIDDRTVHRDEIERDLERYVRRRVRRGHARGWGPYLVLLYGTVMTLGAFYFLGGGWAILAMLVIWLSTLGLYVLMLLVGVTSNALGLPSRLKDRVQDFRE